MGNKKNASRGMARFSMKTFKYVIIAVIVVAFAMMAYNFGTKIFSNRTMEEAPGTDMTFTFEEGTTIDDVGSMLEEYQVIDDSLIFAVQSYVYNIRTIKPGTYMFNTSQTSEEIFDTISSGPEENKADSDLSQDDDTN